MPHSPHRSLATIATATLLTVTPACQRPPSNDAGTPETSSSATLPPGQASPRNGDGLAGRLLHEVVPDSALWGSWGVYPLERHVGLRLAQLADGWWLLADTLVGYDGPKALWRIRAARAVPTPNAGEGYVGSCTRLGAAENDGTIVARVTLSAGEALTPIHGAWRLDPVGWRLSAFPADSLACYNEGGG